MPDITVGEQPTIRTPRDAVLAALSLTKGDGTKLPTARTRIAVERLMTARTVDGLVEMRVDMKALMSDLFDWDGPRATKATVRTAGRQLQATRDDGASLYPQAVEALSFAAACAPLLQPDRLARIVEAASSTAFSYGPVRYPATLSAALARTIGHYQEARREKLLLSLWEAAHDGRWWDHTGNLGRPGKRRKRGNEEQIQARSQAIANAYGARSGADVVRQLMAGELTWTPPTAVALRAARISPAEATAVAEYAGLYHEDPDIAVLVAQLVDLAPGDRPESPISRMVEALEFLVDEGVPAEVLPKRPDEWSDLYPKASLAPYPIPEPVSALDWQQLPGTGVAGVAAAAIELIRNPHALFENKEFMGNCTGGYNDQCLQGRVFLGKIHQGGEIYNFSLYPPGAGNYGAAGPNGWRIGEVNSRHNRGQVPDAIRNGMQALAAGLPA